MTMKNTNSKAKLKLKELNEFIKVLEKASEQFCWAMDFTSFTQIQDWSGEILDLIEEIQAKVENEYYYLDYQLSEYDWELAQFNKEHEVEVN
jgi:tRNA U38,U39,U40 pseudouridine synthase TruA